MDYNRITSDYAAERAANSYSQRLSQQRGLRDIGYSRESYNERTPGFVSGWAKRGLAGAGVKSGVYSRALSNYARDQFRNVQGIQDNMQEEWNSYEMANRNLDRQRQSALAELEWQKRMEIAAAAAELAGFSQYK